MHSSHECGGEISDHARKKLKTLRAFLRLPERWIAFKFIFTY